MEYFYVEDGQTKGPITLEELKKLPPETLCSFKGADKWIKASEALQKKKKKTPLWEIWTFLILMSLILATMVYYAAIKKEPTKHADPAKYPRYQFIEFDAKDFEWPNWEGKEKNDYYGIAIEKNKGSYSKYDFESSTLGAMNSLGAIGFDFALADGKKIIMKRLYMGESVPTINRMKYSEYRKNYSDLTWK